VETLTVLQGHSLEHAVGTVQLGDLAAVANGDPARSTSVIR